MNPILKKIGIYLLIALGLIAFAILRGLSNILRQK